MLIEALLVSTGNAKVDAILSGTIGVYQTFFPERIRGYYLYGSYAAGEALPTSDIDLVVLFADDFRPPDEQKIAWQLSQHCASLCSYELDVVPYSEVILQQILRTRVLLKRSSICIYGDDIRPQLAWPNVPLYAREITHGLYSFLAGIRGHPSWLRFPLTAQPERNTRSLLRLLWPLAGAMVTVKSGEFSGGKRECITRYRTLFQDAWGDWLTLVWNQCRVQWHDAIPETDEGQGTLRQLCAQALQFENHFLSWYRMYLVNELESQDVQAQRQALRQLGKIIYADSEIEKVLRRYLKHNDVEIRQTAEEIQEIMQTAAMT